MRFLCRGKGNKRNSRHKTFSLLPSELVPYRALTLKYIIISVLLRFELPQKGLDKVLDEICNQVVNPINQVDLLNYFTVRTLSGWIKLIMSAFHQFIEHDTGLFDREIYLKLKENQNNNNGLILFLKTALEYQSKEEPRIRGPSGLANDYYNLNKTFLFGRPSQAR